jgi:endo-1,4-beta-xylanase
MIYKLFPNAKVKWVSLKYFKVIIIVLLLCLAGIGSKYSYAQPLAEGKSKFLGNAIGNTFHSNYDDYWNQVSPGNAGKWGSVEYTQDSYNWTQLDNIYNYAISNDFIYKHHTLIWGSQQPGWITSLDSASQRAQIEEWIQLVGARYPDMDFVDVVNEPFNAPPPYLDALGGTGTTGWDWIVTSFQLARQYLSPGVKLVLNEYNVLHSNAVTDNYLQLIDTLKVRGLIDAIGIQGHYFEFKSSEGSSPSYEYSIATIKYNLNRLTATGLPVYITEFDINEANDNTQLENYKIYFPIFWENPGVKGMTLWGYVLYDMWKPNAYLVDDRRVERPAMEWLRAYLKTPISPIIIYPDFETDLLLDPVLQWHSSEMATFYNIQLADNRAFTNPVMDTTTADTVLQSVMLEGNTRYYWRVNAANDDGTSDYTALASFTTGDDPSAIEKSGEITKDYQLFQNYPNPFNPITAISYRLSAISEVELNIYDTLGQKVAILVSETQSAGDHHVTWNARDFPSGVYYYQLLTDGFHDVRKMILLN